MQLCIVHLVRAALRYVSTEDSKLVARDLKKIYQAATVLEAEAALDEFAQAWDAKYPTIAKQWRAKWADIITLFDFPPAIRKAIYTTNAIEIVNSVIRKFTRNRKIYPNEESALKLVFMAIREAAKKWTMPIHHWKQALNHFAILYEDRMPELDQFVTFCWRDTKRITGPRQPQYRIIPMRHSMHSVPIRMLPTRIVEGRRGGPSCIRTTGSVK